TAGAHPAGVVDEGLRRGGAPVREGCDDPGPEAAADLRFVARDVVVPVVREPVEDRARRRVGRRAAGHGERRADGQDTGEGKEAKAHDETFFGTRWRSPYLSRVTNKSSQSSSTPSRSKR